MFAVKGPQARLALSDQVFFAIVLRLFSRLINVSFRFIMSCDDRVLFSSLRGSRRFSAIFTSFLRSRTGSRSLCRSEGRLKTMTSPPLSVLFEHR